jgi:hypothetical protein
MMRFVFCSLQLNLFEKKYTLAANPEIFLFSLSDDLWITTHARARMRITVVFSGNLNSSR